MATPTYGISQSVTAFDQSTISVVLDSVENYTVRTVADVSGITVDLLHLPDTGL